MPAHAGMRARAPLLAAGRRRCRARAWAWAWVRVPYPAWFFLNPVSRVWVAPLPEPDPLRYPNRPLANGSEPPANGWTERLRLFCPNRRNC